MSSILSFKAATVLARTPPFDVPTRTKPLTTSHHQPLIVVVLTSAAISCCEDVMLQKEFGPFSIPLSRERDVGGVGDAAVVTSYLITA